MTAPEKKRSWQSYQKENADLRGIIQYLIGRCPKCDGSGKRADNEGKVHDCGYCGQAIFRYRNATGETHTS